MPIPQVPSPLMTLQASKMYNAAWYSGNTNEEKITNAIAAAAADGAFIVFVPLSMIPYDPTLVTFNTSVKMVREGGNQETFDVVAYGGRQANGSISYALEAVIRAVVANGGGTVDLMTPYGTWVLIDVDPLENYIPIYDKTPITFLWGSFEVRIKHRITTRSHHHHIFHGTRFILKDENGARVLSVYPFISQSALSGVGGPGNGITTTSGSPTVTKTFPAAANWAKLEVGSPVLVMGFVPPLGTDDTTINIGGGISSSDTSITVTSTTGFPANAGAGGYIRIENEIITYTSKDSTHFLGCTRGAEGTTAAAHANTTRVDRVVLQPFFVQSISGNTFTLDGNMDINATNLTVWIGDLDVSFDGTADFDGNLNPGVDDTSNPQAIYMHGARQLYIGPGITFRNWDHGGWSLISCQDSTVFGRGYNCTQPTLQLGAAFWVFAWSKRITVDILEVNGAYEGLAVDDRTTTPTFTDGPVEDSSFRVRVARNIGNPGGSGGVGLLLDGVRRCSSNIEYFHQHPGSTSAQMVGFGGAAQWVTENAVGRLCVSNVIEIGAILGNGTQVSVNVTPAGDDDNTLIIKHRAPVAGLQPNNNLITVPALIMLTYGTTIATDAARAEDFAINATNGVAFTISNPTNPTEQRRLTYNISNSSGGAMGAITWGSEFRLSGAFVNPANNQYRQIEFRRVGSQWREQNRTAADQPV